MTSNLRQIHVTLKKRLYEAVLCMEVALKYWRYRRSWFAALAWNARKITIRSILFKSARKAGLVVALNLHESGPLRDGPAINQRSSSRVIFQCPTMMDPTARWFLSRIQMAVAKRMYFDLFESTTARRIWIYRVFKETQTSKDQNKQEQTQFLTEIYFFFKLNCFLKKNALQSILVKKIIPHSFQQGPFICYKFEDLAATLTQLNKVIFFNCW